ncbi:aromatic amino acid ammonia-lyase [Vibrio chagasii]|nr:aromatic amino acid ammonia-lyase [Vibrio chagasii]
MICKQIALPHVTVTDYKIVTSRCAPHVIGGSATPLLLRQMIENELNSVNDNQLSMVIMNAYCTVDTSMVVISQWQWIHQKLAVANLADLLDRQMAQLMDYKFNNGSPFNLTGAEGERKPINHGFKAVQIGVSAWTAEALKHTMPASVFAQTSVTTKTK